MKKHLIISMLLFAASITHASTIYSTVGDDSRSKVVVAVIKKNSQLSPVTYEYQIPTPGDLSPVVTSIILTVDSGIPSILMGTETHAFSGEDEVLHVGGKDIKTLDYSENSWLFSVWLGWVYAENYPNVFSYKDGWVRIYEVSDEVFWIYQFDTKEWIYRNLGEEWKKQSIPLIPTEP